MQVRLLSEEASLLLGVMFRICLIFTLCAFVTAATQTPKFQTHGSVAQNEDATEKAIKALLAANPNEPEARLLLGDFYLARGRLKEAMVEYKATISLRQDFVAGYARTAYVLMELEEDAEKAMGVLVQGTARAPDAAELHAMLGQVYLSTVLQKGKPISTETQYVVLAEAEFEKALQCKSGNDLKAAVYLALAALYHHRSETVQELSTHEAARELTKKALGHYQQAFSLNPAYKQSLTELEAELAFPRPRILRAQPGSQFEGLIRERLQRLEEKLKNSR